MEALRLAVHRPDLVAGRLDDALFADDLQRRTYAALAAAEDLRQAVDRSEPEVAELLRRLSVEEPLVPDDPRTDPADPVIAQLVGEAARRSIAERRARSIADQQTLASLNAETASATLWLQDLDNPERCREAADRLVAWLLEARQEGR